MKYGQMAESTRINATIYYCFSHLPEQEALKFVRKFREQPHDQVQVMHTFRELILGAYLSKNGFTVTHDHRFESKTPDWCMLDNNSTVQCVIELVNFHPDAATSEDIAKQLRERGIWCNFTKPNTERLYQSIMYKVSKYKALVTQNNLPYIVSVFGEFMADIESSEIEECILHPESGIFNLYPELSGLLYFTEGFGNYYFTFLPNDLSSKSFVLPNGVFGKSGDDSDRT